MRGRHVLCVLLKGVPHSSAIAVAALHCLQISGGLEQKLKLLPALHTCRDRDYNCSVM